MRKKNKRKSPEFKKPFIVLTRRKIAGWVFILFFLCAWMFVLGILVGRGTAPVKFDIEAFEKKAVVSKKDDPGQQEDGPANQDSAALRDKTKLEFYEALKENSEDTKVPVLEKPKVTQPKVPPPAKETDSPKTGSQKSEAVKTPQKDAAPEQKSPAAKKPPASGPLYTIQAASVKHEKDADQLVQKLKESGYPAYRAIGKVPEKGIWFRVRIGEYNSKIEARRTLDQLKKLGFKPILVKK